MAAHLLLHLLCCGYRRWQCKISKVNANKNGLYQVNVSLDSCLLAFVRLVVILCFASRWSMEV